MIHWGQMSKEGMRTRMDVLEAKSSLDNPTIFKKWAYWIESGHWDSGPVGALVNQDNNNDDEEDNDNVPLEFS